MAGGAVGVLPCHLNTELLSEGSFRVGLLTSLLSSDPWKVICSKQKTHGKGWSSGRDAQLQRVGTSLREEWVSHWSLRLSTSQENGPMAAACGSPGTRILGT